LTEDSLSYALEDWSQRLCLKESFTDSGGSLETLLGLRLGFPTLERMNRILAGYASAFRASMEPQLAEVGGWGPEQRSKHVRCTSKTSGATWLSPGTNKGKRGYFGKMQPGGRRVTPS
jgi:hypothetical protein